MWRVLFLILVVMTSTGVSQKITHDELLEVLKLHSWRVALPKDTNYEWKIEVVDYEQRKFSKLNLNSISSQKMALIILQDAENDSYKFHLKQNKGMSSGKLLAINLCKFEDTNCDNSYSVDFIDDLEPFDNGTKYLLANISGMIDDKPKKQIILIPVKFRM